MSCITCSKVTLSEQQLIRYYKNLYNTKGLEYYVYRLSSKSGVYFVEKSYFETIFNTQIKPNFSNGAEYFSIKEFKP